MKPLKKDISRNRVNTTLVDKLRDPIRVELEKKYTNPETFHSHKYNYMPHERVGSNLEDYIRSPYEKSHYVSRQHPVKTCPSLIDSSPE